MTAQSTNYFFINRKTDGLLEFTIWLSEQHIPVKQDLNEPISTAVDKAKITYLKLLKEGIKECRKYRYTRSTSKLQKLYDDMEKQSKAVWKDTYKTVVEEERQQREMDVNWRNLEYTRKNFCDIVERAKNFVGDISAEEKEALDAIADVFSVIDADSDSMLPISSGVIDLTDPNSACVSALVQRMRDIIPILSRINFTVENCRAAVWEFVEQFAANIKSLSSVRQLTPSLMPNVGSNDEELDQAWVVHDLVDGLRKIWSIKPSFADSESDYSEGSYANMVIGNILNPIFAYQELLVLKREWAEKASAASLRRKKSMGARRYGNKPDFSAILHHKEARLELLFAEFSMVNADEDKHRDDWCKLIRFAKDGYDAIQDMLEGLNPKDKAVVKARQELMHMPIFVLQVANTSIKFAALNSFLGVVLKDFPLLSFDLPLTLKMCGSNSVQDVVKNALIIRGYVIEAAEKLSKLWDDLEPLRQKAERSREIVEGVEHLSITTTSPHK